MGLAQRLKRLPAMRETWVRTLGWEDALVTACQLKRNNSATGLEAPGCRFRGDSRMAAEWHADVRCHLTEGREEKASALTSSGKLCFDWLFQG